MRNLQLVTGFSMLIIAFLFDEISTVLFFLLGMGVGEANPLYQHLGTIPFLIVLIAGWVYMFYFWYKNTTLNINYKKWYSKYIFNYICCFVLVLFFVLKVSAGMSNYGYIYQYLQGDSVFLEQLEEISLLRENDYDEYKRLMVSSYFSNLPAMLNIITMLFIQALTFLLFLTGLRERILNHPQATL